MLPSLKSTNINGFASLVHSSLMPICSNLSKVYSLFDLPPESSTAQHFLQVSGFLPSKNSCRKRCICLLSLACSIVVSPILNLFPRLSFNSSSAKQQGRKVPIGLVSILTHGKIQNVLFGKFIKFRNHI